ncbi:MAG TPA: four-carbon acid sugar kinase family protein [Coprothermobacter proteolyticus]|nr:four-carbon acid sugar kinase family protein [Coprothermobacter proteolyticus]
MLEAAIIADDFTGANATGILLKKKGLKVTTLLKPNSNIDKINAEVISISTNSRSIDPKEAYKRVYEAAKTVIKSTPYVAKRIDSTLRGNLGAEIDAVLDAAGEGYRAAVVPVYPKSGRVCVGGYLLVNGTPLQLTEVAKDPKCPIRSSNVKELISSQTKRSIANITLDIVAGGRKAISDAFFQVKEDIVVFDAVTDDDIENIASALSGQEKIICVDPGPFTAAFIEQKMGFQKQDGIFLILGSVSELTTAQLNYLLKRKEAYICKISVPEILTNEEAAIKKALEVLIQHYKPGLIMGISTKGDASDVLDLQSYSIKAQCDPEEISNRINETLSRIAYTFVKDKPFSGIYITGGDTALAFFDVLGINEFTVESEVLPLAVHGTAKVNDRLYNVVTKGGLVGNVEALYDIVNYLESLMKGE